MADYSLDDALAEHLLAFAEHIPDPPLAERAERVLSSEVAVRHTDSATTSASGNTAAARWSDSAESWDAPPTKAERDRVRKWVLGAVRLHGPITDDALLDLALRERIVAKPTSSVRSRRNELQRDGFVVLVDKNGRTSSNRRAARWSLSEGTA